MSKELTEIVRCKNCIHRPVKVGRDENRDITYPPEDSRGYKDFTCPCLNEDDYWYSWYPSDEWFCAEGEAKGEKNGSNEMR